MTKAVPFPLAAVFAVGVGVAAFGALADEPSRLPHGSDPGFPTYTREDQARQCVNDYGIETTSVIDCIAKDQDLRALLSRRWPGIDDQYKTDCLVRLEGRQVRSYLYLDRCIHALENPALETQ